MRRLWLGFWLIHALSVLSAQSSAQRFEALPGQGTSIQGEVTTILQDTRGFMWLGTWSGLMRFDGYTLTHYQQRLDTSGLQSNKITALFEDRDGYLWIGTQRAGLYRFDARTEQFRSFDHDPQQPGSLSNGNVWSIHQDRQGRLWVGTEAGLNWYDAEAQRFHALRRRPGGLSNEFVYDIAETEDGSLWLATEQGLNRVWWPTDAEAPQVFAYTLDPAQASPETSASLHDYLYTVVPHPHARQQLWVGSKAGLKRISWNEDPAKNIKVETIAAKQDAPLTISHDYVTQVLPVPGDSALWIGTYRGLNRLDLGQGTVAAYYANGERRHALRNPLIRALYLDRTDLLWIGTANGANLLSLQRPGFHALPVQPSEGMESNSLVSALAYTPSERHLWVGTFGGGFSRLDWEAWQRDTMQWDHFHPQRNVTEPKMDFVSALLPDSAGGLWVASQGSGVMYVSAQALAQPSKTVVPSSIIDQNSRPALTDNYVMAMERGRGASLWLGLWDGGLARYDLRKQELHNFAFLDEGRIDLREYPNVVLTEATLGGDTLLWVGTRGHGVLVLAYDEDRHALQLRKHLRREPHNPEALSNDFINCFLVETDCIWIGTENGLNRYDRQKDRFSRYVPDGPHGTQVVQSIERGQDGRLWISTQQGLLGLDATDSTWTAQRYNTGDGLQSEFFSQAVSWGSRGGQLIFGGANGLSVFDPRDIRTDSIPPQVAIVGLRLFNRPIQAGEEHGGRIVLPAAISQLNHLTLSYQDEVVSFEFVGMHYDQPDQHRYAYRLENFDDDWIYTRADQRLAHYTNLPPGEYTFKVKATNGDGVWSPTPAVLRLTVHPPPWRTPLAYGAYALALAGLLLGLRHLALLRANLRNRWQLERVEREKVEAISLVKQRFFTNVSHELRTPLTLIISPLEQLMRERANDPRLRDQLQRMHRQAKRLLTLINQLLDMRRREEGAFQLQVAAGNLVAFTREVVSAFDTLAQERGIELAFDPQVAELQAWYDRDQMEKILFNLLSNALKFTPAGGRVTVRLSRAEAGEEVRLDVIDTGQGIPADKQEQVFERFFQVESPIDSDSHYPGSGIGLALTRSLVEAHHGRIAVDSEVGKGTRFTIFLPLGEDHFSEAEKLTSFHSSEEVQLYHAPLPPPSEPEAIEPTLLMTHETGSSVRTEKPQLLVVEDNADIRSYLIDALQSDYQMLEASHGVEGLALALEHVPDLVITDLAMPEMDGLALCRRLKTEVATSHVPVILLTARTSLLHQLSGYETGADDYVTKPFHLPLLQARIRNLIRIRQQLQANHQQQIDLNPSEVAVTSLDQQLMQRLKDLVEARMDDSELTVEFIAQELGMSRMQLYRKLKSLTGKSPNQVLRTIRLRRAAQLLQTQQYTVSEVTYMVGFQDLKYFRERFKETFGVSPSAYSSEAPVDE